MGILGIRNAKMLYDAGVTEEEAVNLIKKFKKEGTLSPNDYNKVFSYIYKILDTKGKISKIEAYRLGRGSREDAIADAITDFIWREIGSFDPDEGSLGGWIYGKFVSTWKNYEFTHREKVKRELGKEPPLTSVIPAEERLYKDPDDPAIVYEKIDPTTGIEPKSGKTLVAIDPSTNKPIIQEQKGKKYFIDPVTNRPIDYIDAETGKFKLKKIERVTAKTYKDIIALDENGYPILDDNLKVHLKEHPEVKYDIIDVFEEFPGGSNRIKIGDEIFIGKYKSLYAPRPSFTGEPTILTPSIETPIGSPEEGDQRTLKDVLEEKKTVSESEFDEIDNILENMAKDIQQDLGVRASIVFYSLIFDLPYYGKWEEEAGKKKIKLEGVTFDPVVRLKEYGIDPKVGKEELDRIVEYLKNDFVKKKYKIDLSKILESLDKKIKPAAIEQEEDESISIEEISDEDILKETQLDEDLVQAEGVATAANIKEFKDEMIEEIKKHIIEQMPTLKEKDKPGQIRKIVRDFYKIHIKDLVAGFVSKAKTEYQQQFEEKPKVEEESPETEIESEPE